MAALSIILFTSIYLLQSKLFRNRKKAIDHLTYHQLLFEIKDVLNPTDLNVEEQLTERALANQRLIHALHLSNTFVSPDSAVHKAFVTHAQHLLKGAQRQGWAHFQSMAIEAVQWQLSSFQTSIDQPHSSKASDKAQEGTIKFDSFVQNITLIVVLVGLLQVDKPIHSFSHHNVTLVARRITTLWALSKKFEPIPPVLLEDLTTHLRHLVPMKTEEDEAHFLKPLDFLIPAWETLWRVVATSAAYACRDGDMKKAFEDFNDFPSDGTFRSLQDDKALSVKSIVSEAMRLHPPSKHIGRLRRRWRWCPSFIVRLIGRDTLIGIRQADIERLLRCEIWGPDADEFRPSRHHHPEFFAEQAQAMAFVFGHGPLRCIAGSWAPVAVGVIAGAVLNQLEINGYALHAGPMIGGREGWDNWIIKKTV